MVKELPPAPQMKLTELLAAGVVHMQGGTIVPQTQPARPMTREALSMAIGTVLDLLSDDEFDSDDDVLQGLPSLASTNPTASQ